MDIHETAYIYSTTNQTIPRDRVPDITSDVPANDGSVVTDISMFVMPTSRELSFVVQYVGMWNRIYHFLHRMTAAGSSHYLDL